MADERPSFFAQLQERHVFRVAAMYAVTAWLLLQIGSVTFEPLGFPAWAQRALIVAVAIGFPIALALAWIFDVTPAGVVRTGETPAPTLSRGRKLDLVIIVMLLASLAMSLFWRPEPAITPAPVTDASVAVLPFVAMSDDAALRHLGEGLAEQVTNALADRPTLRVASRTSAFEAQAGRDATEIAHKLGVSFVLEGSVRPAGARVRVTAQLVRGVDGSHVWSETYDVDSAATTELDRTADIVAFLVDSRIALEQDLQRARAETPSPEAYGHYASALRLRRQLNEGGTPALRSWEQMLGDLDLAIASDPLFVRAHALRANVFFNKLGGRACGERCPTEAHRSLERALELAPDNPDVLRQLANVQLAFDLDPAAAESSLDRARRIDPRARLLYQGFGAVAMFRGDVRTAREYLAQALDLMPYDAALRYFYGVVLRSQGDQESALREFGTAMRVAPRTRVFVWSAVERIRILLERGDLEQAQAEFAPLWTDYRYVWGEHFGSVLARLGLEVEARELAERLVRDPTIDPQTVFLAYYGLGEHQQALAWLRRAIDDRGQGLAFLRLPNMYPGLQETPGYAEVLKYLESQQRSR